MKKLLLSLLFFAPTALFAQKFGHCDAQSIMTTMPEYIQAEADIKKIASQKEDELKSMQKEFQTKYEDYTKNESTMSATKKAEAEKELEALDQKVRQAYQDGQQELSKMQQEKMQPIMNKLIEAIKQVGKEGGYVYIMDVSNGIPYISETLSKDVTTEVKNALGKMK